MMVDFKLRHSLLLILAITFSVFVKAQPIDANNSIRNTVNLNEAWETILLDSVLTDNWIKVNVPHNWDDYAGFRREVHGNLHSSAMYRKVFELKKKKQDEQYFLWFEGVGSYATVWLNGDSVAYHAGGRTSFTIDITDALKKGDNKIEVRADHPSEIRNLPWVCGGCSKEWGFCEGSQPLGIFRPVHLITTKNIRIEPFGVHVWNDNNISEENAHLKVNTEIKNYSSVDAQIRVENKLLDAQGNIVVKNSSINELKAGQMRTVSQELNNIANPQLWSVENPYLYTLQTLVFLNNKLIDQLNTPYGIRWIKWDIFGEKPTNRFYLNGKPVFINGTAEYEHLMGRSHAFTSEMVEARVEQVVSAGYNSFRDAHQPHNLLYNKYWDELGVLWWTQMSAHIWFDNPEFKENFKTLLVDWVKERRNSPSIILWGLENESTLPKDFAEECTAIIRELDPTTSSQRLVTTCNGGEGTDWNVVQNWSGTYGGNPWAYDEELSRQLLNGEYGAWRSIDLHTEGNFKQKGKWSEDRFDLLMESKIRLAEKASDRVCGQYHWLLNSHENPGRTQGGEGYRELDRVGPVNYKGLITPWGEITDGYYMYRANYVSPKTEPMVYIVSHTWADRWLTTGIKDSIRVYSNCSEVELFSGVREKSLGRLKNPGKGYHFVFNGANVENNVLYAVGYQNGKEVASDVIVMNHLPTAKNIEKLSGDAIEPLSKEGNEYIYRVNCGGANYTDKDGNLWQADVHWNGSEDYWGSTSWTDDYQGLPAFYGSQRQTNDPIKGTNDWKLLQSFRYGMHKLKYHFPLPDGKYQVDLYFIEPWYGTGGGMKCENWRVFDVAINGKMLIKDLDIWLEVGHDKMLKKTVVADVKGGMLEISFPEAKAGVALVSAIAISSKRKVNTQPATPSTAQFVTRTATWEQQKWLNTGDDADQTKAIQFAKISPKLYGAEWFKPISMSRTRDLLLMMNEKADVYLALAEGAHIPEGFKEEKEQSIVLNDNANKSYVLYKKTFEKSDKLSIPPYSNSHFALLAIVPSTTLDDARDLRPSVTYQAADARNVGEGRAESKWNREARMVEYDAAIEWTFQTGLASKYGLEIRYSNPSDEDVKTKLTIESVDGRPMSEQEIIFEPSGDRWRSYRTDTGSIINAGTYRLTLSLQSEKPMWFQFLRVQ